MDTLRLIGPSTQTLTPKYRTLGKSLAADVTLPTAPATYMTVMVVKAAS